jgi:transposase, IS5 family
MIGTPTAPGHAPTHRKITQPGSEWLRVVSHGKADPARSAKSANTGAAFRRSARWRTGSEARIATLKRPYLKRPYLGPHPLDGLDKARIWSGHGVPAQNLVKIAALTA